ncbi:unnamed protein product [Closterium sp. NIES-53]
MWVKLVRYLSEKGVQGFPKRGYGTYYTTYGFGELTQATATWLQTTQLQHVLSSPFVGISIDESTDRCSGKHLILFITFVRDFKVVTEFMALLTVEKADAASLLGVLLSHLLAVGVDLQCIAGISTDGANVMMGCKGDLTTRLRVRIPHLVSSHCIAHRYGFGELTQATATWLQTTQLQHVLSSPFVGISIDESTDRCSGKHLILFITFVREFKVVTEFMALLTVEKADAASLLGVLLSHLLAVGVDLQCIAGISTDGANVMMGCKGDLTTRLRVRIPHLVSSHCIAHRAGVAIFDLDYDAILAAMYAVSTSDEGDCYLCLPPDPGGEVAALGACEAAALGASASAAPGAGESALSDTTSAQVFHTFTLDSGASRSFFRDRTTLTPLSWPVAVSLADPSGGPVLASFSTVLPCPAAPSGTLSGLYLPSFSTNLVAASSQEFAAASGFGPESAPCSCHLLSHQTLLWHHRLGHPSLPRLQGMASRVLVSGLPRSLPPLPPGLAPTCVPCVEGRQRAAPHSSEFPPTEAPLQTLHMDVWGPARVRGQGHERYFLLVVDNYSRYTTVFPLRSKGDVTEVLIDWIRAARLKLRESFSSDFPVLRLHSDRGGEFSSARLGSFFRAQGIRQTFTLPASPQQNGMAERHIGMVMDVARTSMIHAVAPHFLWPFAVQYVAHQLNLQPRFSLPETSPTLRWMGKVGDASAFRVWGSRAFVRDLSADKLSPRTVPCVFLGFPPDAPGWQFYHPTSRRVLSSQDVTFDELVLPR